MIVRFRLGNITETRPVHGKLDHHVSAGRKRDGYKQLPVSVKFTKYGNTLFRPVEALIPWLRPVPLTILVDTIPRAPIITGTIVTSLHFQIVLSSLFKSWYFFNFSFSVSQILVSKGRAISITRHFPSLLSITTQCQACLPPPPNLFELCVL